MGPKDPRAHNIICTEPDEIETARRNMVLGKICDTAAFAAGENQRADASRSWGVESSG